MYSAHRLQAGVTLVPNLFGKPTLIVFGGGTLTSNRDEVDSAFPYVESHQVIIS